MLERFSVNDSALLRDILCSCCGIHEYSSLVGCYVGHRRMFNSLEEGIATIFWWLHSSQTARTLGWQQQVPQKGLLRFTSQHDLT
jgi:hypothetical protein